MASRKGLVARRLVPLVAVAVLFAFSAPPALAGSVDTNPPFTLLTGKLTGQGDGEAMFLWDHVEKKLAVYLVSGTVLKLLFVRDCQFDFAINKSLGKHEPTVREVKELGRRRKGGQGKDAGKGAGGKKAGEEAGEKAGKKDPVAGSFTLALGKQQGMGDSDLLYIFSHGERRLVVYRIRTDVLELLFSRNCGPDLDLEISIGRMTPRVSDVRDLAGKDKSGKSQESPKEPK